MYSRTPASLTCITPTRSRFPAEIFIVSYRHLDAVYSINRASGAINWKIGGATRPESLTVVNDPVFDAGKSLSGQHDTRVLPDGTVSIFDNGSLGGRLPRVVRYRIDPVPRTATFVEHLMDPTVPTATCCGSSRKLPGGNWVIGWGGNDVVTEVTDTGAVILRLKLDGPSLVYHAEPVMPGVLSRSALHAGMDAQFGVATAPLITRP